MMKTLFRSLGYIIAVLAILLGGVFLLEDGVAKQRVISLLQPSSFERTPVQSTSTPLSSEKISGTTEEVIVPALVHKQDVTVTKKDIVTSAPIDGTIPNTTVPTTVSAPGPLVVPKEAPAPEAAPPSGGVLTQNEIIALTNKERVALGLKPLSFDGHLGAMAAAKAYDMIQKQYFAHVSPDGTDIAMLAETYGYSYLNIGENLALGDFDSSADVVLGWMNSPGHRANILNESFTEIGVSAILGNYEGRSVWYAVQEFGRPQSDCPSPDALLKKKIEIYQTEIDALEISLANLKEEIVSSNLDRETYNAKVEDYNVIVALYNQLIATTKQDIGLYNTQVEQYNTCAGN